MFEWQEQYLTNENSERVSYCSCRKNIKFISSSWRVMFFLLHRHTNNGIIDNFPKISHQFPKISEDSPKFVRRSQERCRTFSENFRRSPKIVKDCRRPSWKPRRYFDHTLTNLSTIWETNLVSAKVSISSLARIWKIRHSSPGCGFVWILRAVYFPVKQSCLYNKSSYQLVQKMTMMFLN